MGVDGRLSPKSIRKLAPQAGLTPDDVLFAVATYFPVVVFITTDHRHVVLDRRAGAAWSDVAPRWHFTSCPEAGR